MFLRPAHYRHPAFAAGMSQMWPQAPGIAAWGLMTGVAMVKSGMSTFEAVAMTLLVFAGSAQLAALPLIVQGAPMWLVWAAMLNSTSTPGPTVTESWPPRRTLYRTPAPAPSDVPSFVRMPP